MGVSNSDSDCRALNNNCCQKAGGHWHNDVLQRIQAQPPSTHLWGGWKASKNVVPFFLRSRVKWFPTIGFWWFLFLILGDQDFVTGGAWWRSRIWGTPYATKKHLETFFSKNSWQQAAGSACAKKRRKETDLESHTAGSGIYVILTNKCVFKQNM